MAEPICPRHVLRDLINDYFTFIHPVIPIPHEASFRHKFETCEYPYSGTFLELIASMVACLTSCFPRRPRHHLKYHNLEHMFPSSRDLIEKCQNVRQAAHGPATHNREYSVHDAMISYLQGATNVSTFQRDPAILYFKECLAIIVSLGLHASEPRRGLNGVPRSNGSQLAASQPMPTSLIDQEMATRVFWLSFASVKSLEQLGVRPIALSIPPSTKSTPWPRHPAEVDDRYIYPQEISDQPENIISEMVGFNINIRLFASYDAISQRELCSGVDELVDWEAQRKEIKESLNRVKEELRHLPPYFQLGAGQFHGDFVLQPPPTYPDPEAGRPTGNPIHVEAPPYEDPRTMMLNIQKANIHATQLSTRSYLIEKYFNLRDAYRGPQSHRSPTSVAPSDDFDILMNKEFDEINTELLHMISTIEMIHMEPNGSSLIHKIRSIAVTLLEPKAPMPEAKSQTYLRNFISILSKLEKTMPASHENNEDDEEIKLGQWANLREEQAKFLGVGGFQGQGTTWVDRKI